jgi:hypothetical protein
MNEQEKAKELFNKMFEPNNHYMNKNIEIDKIIAKQCALIAVNELIKETGSKYWYDVKQEIEKL